MIPVAVTDETSHLIADMMVKSHRLHSQNALYHTHRYDIARIRDVQSILMSRGSQDQSTSAGLSYCTVLVLPAAGIDQEYIHYLNSTRHTCNTV